jgi:hypothetical protein
MFGAAGRTCAELVLHWAPILFAAPLDPLAIRVVLAPVEIGPYNKHRGYHHGDGTKAFTSPSAGRGSIFRNDENHSVETAASSIRPGPYATLQDWLDSRRTRQQKAQNNL